MLMSEAKDIRYKDRETEKSGSKKILSDTVQYLQKLKMFMEEIQFFIPTKQ